jgi:hypothetical protein
MRSDHVQEIHRLDKRGLPPVIEHPERPRFVANLGFFTITGGILFYISVFVMPHEYHTAPVFGLAIYFLFAAFDQLHNQRGSPRR